MTRLLLRALPLKKRATVVDTVPIPTLSPPRSPIRARDEMCLFIVGACERTALPAGAVLWAWDADPEFDEVAGEQWLIVILLPEKWNKQLQYSWRFDPCELGIAGRSKPPPRAPRVERDGAEEEYLVTDDES